MAFGAASLLLPLAWCPPADGAPVTVRYTEGVARGVPVLRSVKGEKLAQGELTQVARDGRVESRLVFTSWLSPRSRG